MLIGLNTLTNCTKSSSISDDLLLGSWTKISSILGQGDILLETSTVKFTSDNKVQFIISGNSQFGNWSKKGNKITITWDEPNDGSRQPKIEFTITELSETKLVWQMETGGPLLIETFIK